MYLHTLSNKYFDTLKDRSNQVSENQININTRVSNLSTKIDSIIYDISNINKEISNINKVATSLPSISKWIFMTTKHIESIKYQAEFLNSTINGNTSNKMNVLDNTLNSMLNIHNIVSTTTIQLDGEKEKPPI